MILLAVFKAHKIIGVAWMVGVTLAAAAEVSSNRTLIIIAILSNVTLLVVTGINAWIGHKREEKREKVAETVAQIPAAITKLEISLDGTVQKAVEAAKLIGHQEGVIKERNDAQARKDAVTVGISEAKAADQAAVAASGPQDVIVKNPDKDAVPMRSVEPQK